MKVSWGETGGKRWGTMCLIFLRGFWANSVVICRSKLDCFVLADFMFLGRFLMHFYPFARESPSKVGESGWGEGRGRIGALLGPAPRGA